MIIEINFWVWGLRLGLGLRFGIQIKDWEFDQSRIYSERQTRLYYYHVTAKLNWLF